MKTWPLVGESIYQFWALAAGNLRAAFAEIAPQLRSVGGSLLAIAADAGAGAVKFLIAIVVAGFLYPSAPAMADSIRGVARKLDARRGDEFVALAGATIRTVSRGVIGISVLQAFFAGIGLVAASIPAASMRSVRSGSESSGAAKAARVSGAALASDNRAPSPISALLSRNAAAIASRPALLEGESCDNAVARAIDGSVASPTTVRSLACESNAPTVNAANAGPNR